MKTLEGDEKIFAATAAVTVIAPGFASSLISPNIDQTITALELFFGRGFLFVFCLALAPLLV